MILTFLIVLIVLLGLIVLHEFGHFVLAKKFGVKVEEFGVGLPPRLLGKKIGETLYSLNLLPFGAFVKIEGEDGEQRSARSFGAKPIWQRCLIILAGVASFWIVSVAIFAFIGATSGIPAMVGDNDNENINNPRVHIVSVLNDSPAQEAGIKIGDAIVSLKPKINDQELKITKAKEVQSFAVLHGGEEVILTIERGGESFDVYLTPRAFPPEGEGAMGVGLARVAQVSYPWYKAPFQGVVVSGKMTVGIVKSFGQLFSGLAGGKGMPEGMQILGPIGIFGELKNAFDLNIGYFLYFLAVISIYLAIFNILPIPALDGGKIMFLVLEAVRKRPISPKVEQKITAAFFMLLIALMILVTIKDITKIF